ncbi:MAG: Sec-independent protein translocase TatA [Clostridiales bacterium]|jgi:sec-independent protein translocase protein TatA|nr:Sec-independent protein translocase TatA [Clostridiales bacterium]
MFGRIGMPELLLVLGIALVIFGPKQLPKLGKAFGRTIRSFKDGVDEEGEKNSISSEEN